MMWKNFAKQKDYLFVQMQCVCVHVPRSSEPTTLVTLVFPRSELVSRAVPTADSAAAHNDFRARFGLHNASSSRRNDDIDPAKMSSAALNKIAPNSPSRAKPSEVEQQIATALYDLETSVPEMKAALRPLQFVSAREVR